MLGTILIFGTDTTYWKRRGVRNFGLNDGRRRIRRIRGIRRRRVGLGLGGGNPELGRSLDGRLKRGRVGRSDCDDDVLRSRLDGRLKRLKSRRVRGVLGSSRKDGRLGVFRLGDLRLGGGRNDGGIANCASSSSIDGLRFHDGCYGGREVGLHLRRGVYHAECKRTHEWKESRDEYI